MFTNAELSSMDTKNSSCMTYAVCTGNLELVKTLINAGVDVNAQDENGMAPLHMAINCCDQDMALLLMHYGANVSAQTKAGNTPLHMAARSNKDHRFEFIIRKLLDYGSDINSLNEKNLTPFILLLESCSIDTLNLYIDRVDMKLQNLSGYSLLHSVAGNEDLKVMNLVLDRGMPINQKEDELGLTPLHLACYYLNPEYAQQLITRGADVNIKSISGLTPIYMSLMPLSKYRDNAAIYPNIVNQSKKVIKLLLEAGCDVNAKANSNQDESVLDALISQKLYELAKIVVHHVVEIEAKTNKPLFDKHHLALISADLEIGSYYVSCQAELEAMKNRKIGNTLVTYFSVLKESLEVVTRYARNEELVKEFKTGDYVTVFPFYSSQFTKKLEEAIRRRDEREKVSIILSETMKLADPSSVIFERICNHLSQEDVNLLINSAAIEK